MQIYRVKVDLTKYIEQHTFNFDDVFDAEDTNDKVCQVVLRYIVDIMILNLEIRRYMKEQRSLW